MDTSLWSTHEIAFTNALSSNPNCGEIHYSIEGAQAPLVSINHQAGTVNVLATDKLTETGNFQFRIKACLWNDLYWEEINCVYSETVYLRIVDPCESTGLNVFQLPRPLRSKLNKGEKIMIPGPYDYIDLQTDYFGLGKCGAVSCAAYFEDHSQPSFLQVNNRVYNSIDGTYNTQLVLRPVSGRDQTGNFQVFIDCEFIEYPDLGVFSQGINVEVLEESNCAPGEGGTNDSSCSESSEEVQSDDDLGNGVSADDSSNDGYSGNDMGSSDSSGDGASLGDNVTSDTTEDGPSDDFGRRRLDDDLTDVDRDIELDREGRPVRRSFNGGIARSYSEEAVQARKEKLFGANQARKLTETKKESRNLQKETTPQPIKTLSSNALGQKCPTGQYLSKDSNQCALCYPRAIFVDRNR